MKADKSERIDSFLASKMDISRSLIASYIKKGYIKVNGASINKSYILNIGDDIEINVPSLEIKKYEAPIDIVYEDEYLLVINKEKGMLVHPAKGEDDTLVNALIDKINIEGDRAGIVHRLDKDTSGLIIVAKDEATLKLLQKEFKERKVHKEYLALLKGMLLEKEAVIDAPILKELKSIKRMVGRGGKEALSKLTVIARSKDTTLALFKIMTGRTHQIRVHAKYIGYPLYNDPMYGDKVNDDSFYLHAYKLSFIHPITGKEMTFMVPLPKAFLDVLINLGYNKEEVKKYAR